MVVPRCLSPEEVSRFEGLVKSGSVTSQKDAKAFEYDIGDMVKVIKGEMKGETGAVRQVRDGNLVIRFWTYGSQLDVYFSPDDVRKLTREEVEQGLDGPTTPLGQDDIDVALGRTPRRRREEQGAPTRREDDNLRVKGSRDTRNRRVDREQRGERERNWVDPVTEREVRMKCQSTSVTSPHLATYSYSNSSVSSLRLFCRTGTVTRGRRLGRTTGRRGLPTGRFSRA